MFFPYFVKIKIKSFDILLISDPELLSRVPTLMLILGGMYLTIQMIACSLVTEPQPDRELISQVNNNKVENRFYRSAKTR